MLLLVVVLVERRIIWPCIGYIPIHTRVKHTYNHNDDNASISMNVSNHGFDLYRLDTSILTNRFSG